MGQLFRWRRKPVDATILATTAAIAMVFSAMGAGFSFGCEFQPEGAFVIHQVIYSSESTMPMQSEDLDEILEHARDSNRIHGISGALVYAEGIFLQILEGPCEKVQTLMANIAKDFRHETVTILREGEVPAARFGSWKMAYVSATTEQVKRWAGIDVAAERNDASTDVGNDLHRTAQFAQDILALLGTEKPGAAAQHSEPDGI